MASTQGAVLDPVADGIRRFNRFYTDTIGTLQKRYLGSPFTLQEARVVFEIGAEPGISATGIRSRAHFDQGHLSRILMRLERADIVKKVPSPEDARAMRLFLTEQGAALLSALQAKAQAQARSMVDHLDAVDRGRLLEAMRTIRSLLGDDEDEPVVIREGRPGDLGLLLHDHATLYRKEFAFDQRFEMYVAQSLALYLEHKDPERDRLWVAEVAGRHVGYVAVQHVPEDPGDAKLRWFLVKKEARGKGVGGALLRTALDFAKGAGYGKMHLWTVNILDAARRQYERAGFSLVEETDTCPWAPWAKEQRWEIGFRSR